MPFTTRKPTSILTGHVGPIHALTYSSGAGSYLLTGGTDRKIHLWNPSTSTKISSYSGHGYSVLSLACSHDNTVFASSGGDKLVFLWDVSTGTTVRRFEGHWGQINAVAFNADSSVLVSGSYDATVRFWDLKSQAKKPVQTLEDAKDAVSDVVLYGHEVLAASVDGRVRAYDLRMGRCFVDVVSPAPLTCVRVSRDGRAMLVSALDGTVRLLDRDNGGLLKAYKGHKNSELRVRCAFAQAEEFVVSGSEDGEVWVWDLLEGRLVDRLKAHAGKAVTCVEFSPVKKQMVTAGADGTAVVWGE
ncbi:WD40-repeat-containing domain protein [Sphaerosporella brunnea]|uniref:WD40-repeat-containing domain protein n=1 Tax=Sphaerosporella brunnea TaxID=1250544 RepID=A0A5J5ESK3_9PEZI|nr:WD40-repeat-containing domain protein [Sphaerosporella brunnea]